jgi:uncharacterized membrane protein
VRGGSRDGALRVRLSWRLFVVWAPLFLLSVLQKTSTFGVVAAGLQALMLLIIVVLHGSLTNGWRGIGAFLLISAAVGFLLEASSIAWGFPFGFYTHNMQTPFKPLGVPIPVVLGYAVLGWLAWSVTRVLVRNHPSDAGGLNTLLTPMVATFVLAGYDYAYDPIGATVLGMWTYLHPSGTFGVPLTNFLGWLFTGWAFFQIFALLERRFPAPPTAKRADLWLLPCLIWGGLSLQYPILFSLSPEAIATRGARSFMIADIYEAAIAASLFTTVFTSVLAAFRVVLVARATHSGE